MLKFHRLVILVMLGMIWPGLSLFAIERASVQLRRGAELEKIS